MPHKQLCKKCEDSHSVVLTNDSALSSLHPGVSAVLLHPPLLHLTPVTEVALLPGTITIRESIEMIITVDTTTNRITNHQEVAGTMNTTRVVNTNLEVTGDVEAIMETGAEEATTEGVVEVTEVTAATTSQGPITGRKGFPTI